MSPVMAEKQHDSNVPINFCFTAGTDVTVTAELILTGTTNGCEQNASGLGSTEE